MSETDILVITEHWLWPYELHKLADISSDFDAHGISDYRLTPNSGVVVVWGLFGKTFLPLYLFRVKVTEFVL